LTNSGGFSILMHANETFPSIPIDDAVLVVAPHDGVLAGLTTHT